MPGAKLACKNRMRSYCPIHGCVAASPSSPVFEYFAVNAVDSFVDRIWLEHLRKEFVFRELRDFPTFFFQRTFQTIFDHFRARNTRRDSRVINHRESFLQLIEGYRVEKISYFKNSRLRKVLLPNALSSRENVRKETRVSRIHEFSIFLSNPSFRTRSELRDFLTFFDTFARLYFDDLHARNTSVSSFLRCIDRELSSTIKAYDAEIILQFIF